MKEIVVSAPSKLHLSGEHSVVYGKPAVLTSTSKRLYVTLFEAGSSSIRDKRSIAEWKEDQNDNYVGKIIQLAEEKYDVKLDGFLSISSEVPRGAGMGSSAAVAVATIAAITQYVSKPWDVAQINELAYEAEKIKHTKPSGGDNSVVSFGGMLWFRKEFEFLRTFWNLSFKIPKSFAPFVLINTGRVETTGEMIDKASQIETAKRERICGEIEDITKTIVQAIHDENEQQFRAAIKLNEHQLEKLGVVSESTQLLIRGVEKIGGVAKISGAGGIKEGSGIILAIHDNPRKLLDLASEFNYPSFQVALSVDGVRIERVVM